MPEEILRNRIVTWPCDYGAYSAGDLVVWSSDRPITATPVTVLARVEGQPGHWVPAIAYLDEDGVARRFTAPDVQLRSDAPILGRSALDPPLGPIWGVCHGQLLDLPGTAPRKRTRAAKPRKSAAKGRAKK